MQKCRDWYDMTAPSASHNNSRLDCRVLCTQKLVFQCRIFFNANLNKKANTTRLKPPTRGRLPLSTLLLSTSVMIDINYGRCLTCNDIFNHNLNNNNNNLVKFVIGFLRQAGPLGAWPVDYLAMDTQKQQIRQAVKMSLQLLYRKPIYFSLSAYSWKTHQSCSANQNAKVILG